MYVSIAIVGTAAIFLIVWRAVMSRQSVLVAGGVTLLCGLVSTAGVLFVQSQLPTVPHPYEPGRTCSDTSSRLAGVAGFLGLCSILLVATSAVLAIAGAVATRRPGTPLLILPCCVGLFAVTVIGLAGPSLCGMN